MPGEYRFVNDHMLGSLTKWLRLAGFDTLYVKPTTHSDLIGIAKAEKRTILSRNTRLFEVREITDGTVNAILIKDDSLDRQIDQVLKDKAMIGKGTAVSRRCSEDNEVLQPVAKETARPFVPRFVYQTQRSFERCPACNRFYWRGTHYKAIYCKIRSHF